MRFLELHAKHFGPLQERKFELQADVFVVLGPNEAGKSSFHAALQTILYGFEKKSRAEHPLAQFGEPDQDLALTAMVQLDDGRRWTVERTLVSYGKVLVQDAEGEIQFAGKGNEMLSPIRTIPKRLFEAVYSLTANDTNMQTDDVHDHIQELLLGETGLRGARPIADVRRVLSEQTQSLWRSDNKGKPKSKQLRSQMREASSAERAAKQRDRELLEAFAEREALQPKLDLCKQERKELRRKLDSRKYEIQWREFRAREREVRAAEQRIQSLPKDALEAGVHNPAELQDTLHRLNEHMAPLKGRLKLDPLALDATQLAWLEQEEGIEAVLDQAQEYKNLQLEVQRAKDDLSDHKTRLSQSLARLGVGTETGKQISKAPVALMDADSQQWTDDEQAYRFDQAQKHPSMYWIAFALLGVLCAVGMALLPAYTWYLFGGCIGFFALGFAAFLNPSAQADLGPAPIIPTRSLDFLQAFGIEADSVRTPGALTRIAGELRQGQEEWRQARTVAQRLQTMQAQARAMEENWQPLADLLLLEGTPDDWLAHLRGSWPMIQKLTTQYEVDKRERVQTEETLASWQQEWVTCHKRLEGTGIILRAAFPERHEAADAYAAWQEHVRKSAACDQELERLRGEAHYHPKWEQDHDGLPRWDLDRIPQDSSDASPESMEDLNGAIEETEHAFQALATRLGALNQELGDDPKGHLARATEVVLSLKEQLQGTLQNRDRLALLSNILEKAENKYREDNQPDVLLRAGRYLSEITDNRYTQLSYPEPSLDESHRPTLKVLSHSHGWLPVSKPLSRGTQEQIYLALRLGTLDYLDAGRERLPLVLDEALVHWDRARRTSLYAVLKTLAKHRQVIMFTCHESFAEEVQELMDARLIQLQGR